MKAGLIAWAGALVALLVLDGVWLGWLMRDFVQQRLGPLMLDKPNFVAAAMFYLVYAVGIWFFAIRPVAPDDGWTRAALLGAALGFIAYATYDLTNTATLKNWSIQFSVVDLLWGTFATAVAASAGIALSRAFGD